MLVSPCPCLSVFQGISFRTLFFILHWGTFSNSDLLNFGIFFQAITEEEWTLPYSVLISCCFSLKQSAVSAWLWLRDCKPLQSHVVPCGFCCQCSAFGSSRPVCLSFFSSCSLAEGISLTHLWAPDLFSTFLTPWEPIFYSVSLPVPLCTG